VIKIDNISIWQGFIWLLTNDKISSVKLRPYHDSLTGPMLSFLKNFAQKITLRDKTVVPKVYQVKDKVHYIVSLDDDNYCLSFVVDKDIWYFQHVECVFIRLDSVTAPTNAFPDISEDQKNWIRQEIDISNKIRLYNFIVKTKDKDFALNWFMDGEGYLLAARTWVPFVSPERAFILYLCWEQSNLLGNKTKLEHLDGNHATVRLKPLYIEIYNKAVHIKQQIKYADYISIFEATWYDRSIKAGWKLNISYESEECIFEFYI
jgi:hypothetical protein